MAIHVLRRSQTLSIRIEECWDFFSNPANLAAITPPELDFCVLSELPEQIYPGMMIEYRVRPLFGIPVTWLTEITHAKPPFHFVDEQRVGPYRLWHHEHFFQSLPDGETEICDLVHYVLPFGPIGDLFHPLLVQGALNSIFEFRARVLAERFGTPR